MTSVSPWTLLASGSVLFLLGLAHRWPPVAEGDRRLFLALHRPLRRLLPFFRVLWWLGTLEGIVAVAILVALFDRWQHGVSILLAYGIVVLGEMGLKRRVNRPRPFMAMPDEAWMGQPRRPKDSSFPSGDALRVWVLAFTVARVVPPPWGGALVVLAALVSLGRIALGVHYPLDVLAGTGLGLVAAALALMWW